MTALGLSPARIRSLACAKWVSRRAFRGPEDDVEVDDESCSSALNAAAISVVISQLDKSLFVKSDELMKDGTIIAYL